MHLIPGSERMAWQIIGHDWAAEYLSRSVAAGRLAHAYIFTGPTQVGKTRLALALAQALNCEEPNSPCGQCPSCRRIDTGNHPDVHLVVGTGAAGAIRIDQVRALRRQAVLAPYEGRYRLFILRRADQATTEATNSLLKILEEPPAHVVLVLTAVQPEVLPPTVLSRCQRLHLRPVPPQVIEEALASRGLAPSDPSLLARLSGGRVGWAISASEDGAVLLQHQQDIDQLLELMAASRVERLDFALKTRRDTQALLRRFELWTLWWRDLLLLYIGSDAHVLNVDRMAELRESLKQATLPQIWASLQALQKASEQLRANVNARLALEGLLLKLPHWQSQAPGTTD